MDLQVVGVSPSLVWLVDCRLLFVLFRPSSWFVHSSCMCGDVPVSTHHHFLASGFGVFREWCGHTGLEDGAFVLVCGCLVLDLPVGVAIIHMAA